MLKTGVVVGLTLIAGSAIALTKSWNPDQLKREADLVAQVELTKSHVLTDIEGMACAARYEAKVSKIEKGELRAVIVQFSMGPDFNSGERFRVYLRSVIKQDDYFQSRVPLRQPGKQLEPSESTVKFLKCPGVMPGWVPLAIERLL